MHISVLLFHFQLSCLYNAFGSFALEVVAIGVLSEEDSRSGTSCA
jgi:hypothetical protein